MKTMTHTKRMDQPLHIEAPGCIINVYAGLTDCDGNQVTAVQILCDDYAGATWRTAEGEKSLNIRIVKQGGTE